MYTVSIAIASPIAVFHEVNHGLSVAVCTVVQRLDTAIRHAALVGGKLYTPPATITAGRACGASAFFFELAHHTLDD
jgi:hypothetical protein